MKINSIIIIFFMLLSLTLFSREYTFDGISNYKTVQLDGKYYNITVASNINLNKYREISHNKLILKNPKNKNEENEVFIVLAQSGELIRDEDTIQKALFTKSYTQLNDLEYNQVVTPIYEIISNFDKAITKLKLDKSEKYFSNLKTLSYIILDDVQEDIDFSDENSKQLVKFNSLILRQPVKGFKITLIEILARSKELSLQSIKLLSQKKNKIVSYEEAMEIDQLRFGLAYGSSTNDFINDHGINLLEQLINAEFMAKKLLKQYPDNQYIKNKDNLKQILAITKRVFRQVYAQEEVFTELVNYINIAREKMLKQPENLKQMVSSSSRYFPYYKSNYEQFSIPEEVKEEYTKVLFYDDFSEGLKRWLLLGPTKSFVKENALNTNGNGWYPSGVSSVVLFNPHSGDTYIETEVKLGEGKGGFGFGEKQLGVQGNKGVLPFIGFIFNASVEGSGSIDFRINNEITHTQFRVMVDLTRKHRFKIKLYQNEGVDFYIDDKKVYHHSFKCSGFGSESVVLSSASNDYSWKKIIVYQ